LFLLIYANGMGRMVHRIHGENLIGCYVVMTFAGWSGGWSMLLLMV